MSKPAKMTVHDWRRGYGVVDPTDKEVITFTLWHRLTYTSGTTTALTFFSAAAAGINGNLPLAGQLPNGWSFLIQAIRVGIFIATTETAAAAPAAGAMDGAIQDVVALIYNSHTRLEVGPKEYGRWPTYYLPSGGGPFGFLAVPGTLTAPATAQYQAASNGPPDPRAVFTLPIPVVIPPQYQYQIVMEWSAAQTLTAGNTPICVSLDGELMRPKQ